MKKKKKEWGCAITIREKQAILLTVSNFKSIAQQIAAEVSIRIYNYSKYFTIK